MKSVVCNIFGRADPAPTAITGTVTMTITKRAPARGAPYVTSFLQNWLFGVAEISKLRLSLYKLSLSLCEFKLSLCELSLSLENGGRFEDVETG